MYSMEIYYIYLSFLCLFILQIKLSHDVESFTILVFCWFAFFFHGLIKVSKLKEKSNDKHIIGEICIEIMATNFLVLSIFSAKRKTK